ncbi:MAG: DUF502 domain-containing protein [Sinomicrobium sp.]|nr:DUF502 domain-containing protein [Sinomicrobium sp.]
MEEVKKNKNSLWQSLGRFFLTTVIGGLIVLLPLSVFLIIFRFALNLLIGVVSPLSNLLRFGEHTPKVAADTMAIMILVLVFFIIGLVVQMPRGRAFFTRLEKDFLDRIPFYTTVREMVQQFTGKGRSPFSQVVMVDLYTNDTRMLGFVTDELEDDIYAIFVPTGPNPASGCIYYVKRHQMDFLNVRPEEAMRCIVAVGNGTRIMLDHAKNRRKEATPTPDHENLEENIGAPL